MGISFQVDGALVWVNPIQDGRDRTLLDAMLREIAAVGVFVSTHPDIILTLGTKEVLYTTRSPRKPNDTIGCSWRRPASPQYWSPELAVRCARLIEPPRRKRHRSSRL